METWCYMKSKKALTIVLATTLNSDASKLCPNQKNPKLSSLKSKIRKSWSQGHKAGQALKLGPKFMNTVYLILTKGFLNVHRFA